MTGQAQARVASIYRFPVKSMQGEQVDRAVVGPSGIVGDRGYAVVDKADGKVASAKNPGKWRSLLGCRAAYTAEPVSGSALPPAVITTPDGVEVRTDDPDVDRVLSELVGRDVTLSSLPESPMLEEVWPDIDGLAPDEFIQSTRVGDTEAGEVVSGIPMGLLGAEGTFFDASPLHLLTTATLSRLQDLEPAGTFDVRRYRPNFLVGMDGSGFAENEWVGESVALGTEVVAAVVIPTMRCVMTTLAQGDDLTVDRSTLKTIARHNRIEIPNLGTWACAGVYASVATPGTVTVGDPVGTPGA